MRRVHVERDEFWTIGDVGREVYLGSKENGCYYGDTLIAVSSIDDCEQMGSREEAIRRMKDEDVRYWMSGQESPKDICPVRIEVVCRAIPVKRGRTTRKG